MKNVKLNYGWSSWAVAAAALVFGLILLIWPGFMANLIVTVACSIAIVAGVLFTVLYLVGRGDPIGDRRLATGVTLIVLGVLGSIFRVALLSFVPWIFGILLFLSGVFKLQFSANMHRMTYDRWWFTLIGAGISIALGLLIVLHPYGTGTMLIRVIGGSIAVEAVQDLLSVRSYDRAVKTHFTD